MQSIAFENNLSETAFFIKKDDVFFIRWFTPKNEIELCGHATLASAHVLFNELGFRDKKLNLIPFSMKNLLSKMSQIICQWIFPLLKL